MRAITRLFVYGTLMPGEERWPLLAPLAAPGAPEAATAAGLLYRTPYGWPAAAFAPAHPPAHRPAHPPAHPGAVPGLVVALRDPDAALPVLDEIEGTGTGLFERRVVETTAGECWAYHWPGPTSGFQPIASWAGR